MQENAGNIVVKAADLAAMNVSEDEKIKTMIYQSTVDYDPMKYAYYILKLSLFGLSRKNIRYCVKRIKKYLVVMY